MKELTEKKALREALKRRQMEIQQCLATFGLSCGPRRLLRDVSAANEKVDHCHRLRACLISLGPVFSWFGIYLSSRVDLLPANYCLGLSTIPDRAAVTPIAAVRELIAREIGRSPDEAYFTVEDKPFESRLLFQSHRAWLINGEAVTIKVIHYETEEYLAGDLELLPLLKSAFASTDLTDSELDSVIFDFRSTLERQLNFADEASAIEQYGQHSKAFEILKVPIVYKSLCSTKVLTIKRLPGIGLDNLVSLSGKQKAEESRTIADAFEGSGQDPVNLVQSLFIVWLRQALMGQSFPVDPRPENIMLLPAGQIAFTGGLFASLPPKAKAQLYAYLIAVATDDTDKACSCLLGETNKQKGACSETDLLHRFRQAVPFRDGGWSNEGNSDSLIERLFLQWRIASRHGYMPQLHLLSFYRGLFLISALARRLAPERDMLMEAVDALRFMSALEQFQKMMGLQQMSENLNKYVVMMMDLPQKLDQALTAATDGSGRMKLQVEETYPRSKQKNSSTVVIATLMVLTAVVLLSNHLATLSVAGAWADRISAIAFVLISALLLRAVSRMR